MIIFRWPELPVSVNKLYFPRQGRLVLSSEGRAWKRAFVLGKGGASPIEFLGFAPNPQRAYCLDLTFYFPEDDLLHPKYGTSRSVKYRFKKVDTSNLIKVAEDAVAELLGLPDRNNTTVIARKRVSQDGTRHMVAKFYPDPEV